jgi:hypothetical protein
MLALILIVMVVTALQGLTHMQGLSTVCKDFPAEADEHVKVNSSGLREELTNE